MQVQCYSGLLSKEKKTYYELCTSMWSLLLADFISQVEFTFSIVPNLYNPPYSKSQKSEKIARCRGIVLVSCTIDRVIKKYVNVDMVQ